MTYSDQYPVPLVCDECRDHAHELSKPTYQPVKFAAHSFVLISYRCICKCGCKAVITTTTAVHWPGEQGELSNG